MQAPIQEEDFPTPVKYGYRNLGFVKKGSPVAVGRVVLCLYPHQTPCIVPADAVHALPDTVPPQNAALGIELYTTYLARG